MANHLMLIEGKNILAVVYGVKKSREAFRVIRDLFLEEPLTLGSYGLTKEECAALEAEVSFEVEEHQREVISVNWEGKVKKGLHTSG